ncbi:hypothetical protein LTS10_005269 [Elasticomyces elasticus]|nr:hypothetical protein LTS10_005269 [Elasticomyces elasticus]
MGVLLTISRIFVFAWKTPGSVGSVVQYIEDVEGEFLINKYVPTDGSVCGFVSPLYLAHGDHRLKSKWLKWLKANLKFRTVPRIQGPSGAISKEFRYIVDNHTSDVWLSILMDFHAQLKPTPRGIHGFEGTISSQLVLCNPSRSSAPLNSTYLPTTAVMAEILAMEHLSLLHVDEPDDRKWQKLTMFGVGVRPNLKFYIDIVRGIRLEHDPSAQTTEHLRRVYEKIETLFGEDVEGARRSFQSHELIGIPLSANQITWCAPKNCRWSAPECLGQVKSLSAHYRSATLRSLFTKRLRIKNATATDIIDEMQTLSDSQDDYNRSKTLLLELIARTAELPRSSLIESRVTVDRLMDGKFFPVRKGTSTHLTAGSGCTWYVADRERQYEGFKDHVWLLDVPITQYKVMKPLFDYLGLSARLLSSAEHTETVTSGQQTLNRDLSRLMQSKGRCLLALFDEQKRALLKSQLQGIQVWTATRLLVRRHVMVNDKKVFGNDDRGRVLLTHSNDSLKLFLSEDDIKPGNIPWHFVAKCLKDHLGIDEKRYEALSAILTTSDDSQIHEILEDVLPDFESVQEISNDVPAQQDDPDHSDAYTDPSDDEHGHPDGSGMRRTSKPRSSANRPRVRVRGAQSSSAQHAHDQETSVATTGLDTAAANLDLSDIDVVHAQSHDPAEINVSSGAHNLSPELPSSSGSMRSKGVSSGEVVTVYQLLKRQFHATEDCWTSAMRSQAGLSQFHGSEGAHSDFTISQGTSADDLRDWLIPSLLPPESPGLNYHIEVKTTTGPCTDPFMMSNIQVRLAEEWHNQPDHAYVIFRVYNVMAEPAIRVYYDPFALAEEGKLEMVAQGGYCVTAT